MLFAQIVLPPILEGNGLLILIGGVLAAYVAWRNKDAIKAKLGMQASADGTSTGLSLDPKADLVKFVKELENGVASSELVRGGSSILCRKLIRIANALPNTAAAKDAHDQLRKLFVEFGDPTPADSSADPAVVQ